MYPNSHSFLNMPEPKNTASLERYLVASISCTSTQNKQLRRALDLGVTLTLGSDWSICGLNKDTFDGLVMSFVGQSF